MDHFSVVQSLCRTGLEAGDERFRRQVERLRQRLEAEGDAKSAATLERLLAGSAAEQSMAPSVVEVSRSLVTGEELTADVHPPTDRETSVPLAQIVMEPGRGRPTPIYNETLRLALDALVSEWRRADALRALGVEPSRSCLLYGPPGSGKTLTAFTLAAKLRLPVVNARIDGLVSSFLGTTARNIANLFDFANRYRCVLVLDEFDALAKMRDDPHELGEIKRVVNTLLQNLDAREGLGLTLAITNHDGLLDPAVWRRFENHVRIDLPDTATRLEMLRAFLRPLAPGEDAIKILAFIAGPRAGSDLKTFTDSLKRALALRGDDTSPVAIMEATRTLLPRFGLDDDAMKPARLFLDDEAAFVGSILESEFGVRQESLAQMLAKSQSTISRFLREYSARRSADEESRRAQ